MSADTDATTAPTLRVPAAEQVDYRARAYDAALNLAELTHSFDPRHRVTSVIGASGATTLQLVGDATLVDAEQLATRLGLEQYDRSSGSSPTASVHHVWTGARAGFEVRVAFLEPSPWLVTQ